GIVGPDAASWKVDLPPLPWTVGEPGAQGRIGLTYSPTSVGRGSATLVLRSNDALQPALNVPLGGLGRDLPPCQFSVVPSPVDFGNVKLGLPVTSGFEIVNTGGWDCIFG